ncbi:RNase P subunit p30 [Metarhizium album ARSEF 1941]|uniref:RNase P subunit p30 n=1 Tax=Metarhizium album (strain ARSEF 1941) TaxID=1081103 RepID=A0A0B2WVF6_METAS|nr:RNase P subunit p30 [Metarhizium album ARSEF 1941]KHN96880.1 RNase P subunit p30 [Metarhizium album ARSEF 1941]
MIYDLNIAWSPSTTSERLLQTLSLASSLGYSTVALNHTLELPFPANPTAPFPSHLESSPSRKLPALLRRATLPLDDPAASNYRLQSLVSVYDILAVRPSTEKAFQNACLTLDIPIVSLDLTSHFPFHFRPKSCMAAVARGVRFEICYAQLLAADNRGRANFISNATSIIRATRGRGIIISSEAKTALCLRGPADVINLLSVWGLASDKGLQGLQSVPRSVVVNEGIKRNGFRGVINVLQVASRAVNDTNPASSGDNDNEPSTGTDTGRSGNKSKIQKRKQGEGDGQSMSSRQTKKLKLAARSAGQDGNPIS